MTVEAPLGSWRYSTIDIKIDKTWSLSWQRSTSSTIALSHQIIDLALHGSSGYRRRQESATPWSLIGELFDAGDAMPSPSDDGGASPDAPPQPRV
jgi:hypothetical protein